MPNTICTAAAGYCGSGYSRTANNSYSGATTYTTIDQNPVGSVDTRDTGCYVCSSGSADCSRGEKEYGVLSCDGSCGRVCARNPPDKENCPNIGTLTKAVWNSNNTLKCSYSDIDTSVMFDDSQMTRYFDSPTIKTIRNDYCTADQTNIETDDCKTWLDDTAESGTNYNDQKMALCNEDPNWPNEQTCRSVIQSILTDTSVNARGNATTAINMVQEFCDENPTNSKCACYNVTKHGSNCFTTESSLPGCSDLILGEEYNSLSTKLNEFQAKIVARQPFCMSNKCSSASTNTNVLLPTRPLTCPIAINVCYQDYSDANLINSQVSSSCQNMMNIVDSAGNPISGFPTTPSSGSPPSSQTSPSPSPSPSPFLSSKTAVFISIGIFVFFMILLFSLLIVASSEDGGNGKN